MNNAPLTPESFLDSISVKGEYENVFVLGSLDRRVTFLAQQTRAINLAVALDRRGRLKDQPKIAVVGGGLAGVTAAVALAKKGARVTVLESRYRAMDHQRGSTERWVHPHIYDWPNPGWDRDDAGLPLMNWRAGTVSHVIERIDQAWQVEREALKIRWEPDAQNTRVLREAGKLWVRWSSVRKGSFARRSEDVDMIVLAVGFGEEAEPIPDVKGYWKNDDLRSGAGRPTKNLVSGCGDGGLIDTLRITLENFEHEAIKQLGAHPALDDVRAEILRIEEDEQAWPDGLALTKAYADMDVPSEFDELLKVRPDTTVLLNSNASDAFTRASSPLNRFLVARLMTKCVDHRRGKLDLSTLERMEGPPVRWRIAIQEPDRTSTEIFDRVVIRHGPAEPALKISLPDIWKRVESEARRNRERPRASDSTRIPIWTPADFPPAPDLSSKPVASPPSPESMAPTSKSMAHSWLEITPDFLNAEEERLSRVDLVDYFDGQNPSWAEAASSKVHTRKRVTDILNKLARLRADGHPWSIHQIHGPGGEGKTTVGMQVAARIARQPHMKWRVFWRDGGRLNAQTVNPLIASGRPLLLVSDNAQELYHDLNQLTQRGSLSSKLHAHPGAELHIVLIYRDFDWGLVSQGKPSWANSNAVPEYPPLAGLLIEDARGMIQAYKQARALDTLEKYATDEAQAKALVEFASGRRRAGQETALLGGLIEARTGRSYEIHVASLLQKLKEAGSSEGIRLLDAYVSVAAIENIGIHGLDARVLAGALGSTVPRLESHALGWLRSELEQEGYGESLMLHTRHAAIARTAVRIFEPELQENLTSIYVNLVRAAVNVPDFHSFPNVLAVAQAASRLLELKQNRLAVVVSEAAHEASPNNIHFLGKLAHIYRETGVPVKGAQFLSSRLNTILRVGRTDGSVRPCVREWAVCCREASFVDSPAQSAWLALFAISDQCSSTPTHVQDLDHVLVIAEGFHLLDPDLDDDAVRMAVAACVVIGRMSRKQLQRLSRYADAVREDVIASIKAMDIPRHFSEAAARAWSRMAPASRLPGFPKEGKLTFERLGDTLKEVSTRGK